MSGTGLFSCLILVGSVFFVERRALFLCVKEEATILRGGGKTLILTVKSYYR